MRTLIHHSLLRNTCLAAIALMATGFVVTTHARSADTTLLTFSRDVALPGVVLPAGTYKFEVANPDSSLDVVRVSSRNGHVHYLGITMPAERPARMAGVTEVRLGEARADSPAPILAWFPSGTTNGHQFRYR